MDQRDTERFEALRRAGRRQLLTVAAGLPLLLGYLWVLAELVMPRITAVPLSDHLQGFAFVAGTCYYAGLVYTAWQLDAQVSALTRYHNEQEERLAALAIMVRQQREGGQVLTLLAGAAPLGVLVAELAAAGSAWALMLVLLFGAMVVLRYRQAARFAQVWGQHTSGRPN